MPRFGYARVSSTDQDLTIQLAKLKAADCEVIRSEKMSGKSADVRPELATVMQFLRAGDELSVDMRRLLDDADRLHAFQRGLTSLRTDELQVNLAQALADRDGGLYRRQPDFAEIVEDRIDELEVELARRDAQRWVGL